ncbi:MAG: ATP-binding protein [Desulforhopalus sp.]
MKKTSQSADDPGVSQIAFELQIDSLRQSHKRLSETLSQCTNLYDSSQISYLSLGQHGIVTELNESLAEMLGTPRPEVLGKPLASFIVEEDQEIFFLNHRKYLEEQRRQSYKIRLKSNTGKITTVRLDYLPLFPSGEDQNHHLAVHDISLFKELGNKLEKEIQLRQNIIDSLPCLAVLLKYDTHEIIAANRAAAAEGAVTGSPCYQLWSQNDFPCPWCRVQSVKKTQKTLRRQLWNEGIYWDHYWIPIADDICLHCAFDITEWGTNKTAMEISINELEEKIDKRSTELEQARQRLQSSEKIAAVGRVSATILQEFNNPLQAISNVLGGIHRRGSLDPEDMPLVDLAYRETLKLTELVRDLREFYQPIHGKTDLLNMQAELENIINLNKQRLSDKGITITTECAENLPLIHAVAVQIKKMLQELLDAVIMICDQHAVIKISAYAEGDTLILQIEDSGCGINQYMISQISEPLNISKAKKTLKDFGLATSYAIITMHGGTIETEGDHENGSVLKVMLPIHNSSKGEHIKKK